jgi:serine/threonine-protein kinase RsbW
MSGKTHTFKLKSKLSELDKLCREVEAIGRTMGLPRRCVFEVNLALDELFTNIISYGYRDEAVHTIKVSITHTDNTLVLCIEDDGIAFNPMEVEEPELPCDIERCKIGGLGIHMIRKLMDEICYERCRGKNILTLKKKVDGK